MIKLLDLIHKKLYSEGYWETQMAHALAEIIQANYIVTKETVKLLGPLDG